MNKKKDNIYAQKMNEISDFSFDDHVVEVFDDMLNRSIPGYGAVLHQIGALAKRFIQPNTHIYDLGCSLGAVTFAIRNCVDAKDCTLFSIDNSEEMIERFERRLTRHVGVIRVVGQCADIQSVSMNNASLVVMNFTLQFIDTAHKSEIIGNIFSSLNPGGAFILSEKIVFDAPQEQTLIEDIYYDLKRHNGYNDLEISQKRDALENVLKLESISTQHQRLKDAGFSTVYTWYQNLNFASFVAIK